MTEGGVTRPKRINTRFFKNPPQPYMCIRDTLMGSSDPCYVNVLSWDKVGFANVFTNDVPLYGGMKVHPPRTEKKEVSVFAVMAHPDVLRQHGKNTHNPQERTWLIDTLLDFVEKMNSGVVFNRRYRVLHDRDITGELKAIWMAVQMQRIEQIERTTYQMEMDSEDLQQPVSSYSQCEEQQQQQKQNSLQQPQKHSPQEHQLQQEQEKQQLQLQQKPQQQQQRQDHSQEQHTPQPPQYHPRTGSQETTSERRVRSRYGLPKSNRTNEGPSLPPTNKHPPAPSLHNDEYVSHDHYSPPNFQDQQQQQQRQTHPDDDTYTPQPPQYHSSVHYAYDRQDSNMDRGVRLHYVPDSQNRAKEGFHSMTNKYPPIQSSSDQYCFHDPSTTSGPQAQQQNCLPYQAYQYQTLPRPMGQPFSPNVPPNPSTNNATVHNPSVSCVNFPRSESTLCCDKFPPNKEIPEAIDRKHPQATHVQLVHSSSANYYDCQNSSLPNLVMLRPEELDSATRQNAPATHVTRTRITSNVVSLLQPHFATLTTSTRTNPSNLAPVTSTIVSQTPNDRSLEKSVTIIGRSSDEETTLRRESLQRHAGAQATCENNSPQIDKRKSDKICKIKVLKRDKSSENVKVAVRETKMSTNGDVERVRTEREKNRVLEDKGNVDDRLVAPNCEKNGFANEDGIDTSEISVKTITTTNLSAKSIVKIFTGGENDRDDCGSKKKTNGQIVTSKSAKDSNDEVSQVYTILRKPEASQDRIASDLSQLSINESSRADKLTNKSGGDTGGGKLRRRR